MTAIFHAALDAADPYPAVLNAVQLEGTRLEVSGKIYDLNAFDKIVVAGAGKATARMAQAMEKLLGARIASGLIVVKEGHAERLDFIEQVEAAHPISNKAGMAATRRILEMANMADEKTLFVCLFSGGASALLAAPAEGLTLGDKQRATSLLLKSGASIFEVNAVRKHLSSVKGGRLAQAAYPAQVLSLIVSDVVGDRLDVIASGPTSGDESSFLDAWHVVQKYHLKMPKRIMARLELGMKGMLAETPAEHPGNTRNVVVAGNRQALAAAKARALELGYDTEIFRDDLQGDAREAARQLAAMGNTRMRALAPEAKLCLLCGGETTVTVQGDGKGGRNQEIALAFAIESEGVKGIEMLSAGTDGSDGPTDADGAFVDGNTATLARQLGLDPVRYLEANDSYGFFSKLDALSGLSCHFKTGPTGTNVMDIQILLCHKS